MGDLWFETVSASNKDGKLIDLKVLEQLIRIEIGAGCSNVLTFRLGLCKTGRLAR